MCEAQFECDAMVESHILNPVLDDSEYAPLVYTNSE